jgi:predicted cupin superfamily sugar epimerase
MDKKNASYWIDHLNLLPHPEGGYYKEVFRSKQQVLRLGAAELKQACTSIYYLLEGADYSGFHRIASDELWYFHKGEPLLIHMVDENGVYSSVELSDTTSGVLSTVVEAGLWFASEIPSRNGFTLVSCAVAPGFEFSEFEMARKENMKHLYPQHVTLFERLCR